LSPQRNSIRIAQVVDVIYAEEFEIQSKCRLFVPSSMPSIQMGGRKCILSADTVNVKQPLQTQKESPKKITRRKIEIKGK
jgi:hypothetical protein